METKAKFQFSNRLIHMECRKDIHTQNQFLNKKQRPSQPLKKSLLQSMKINKRRLYSFGGFCLLYSLSFIYDYIVTDTTLFQRFSNTVRIKNDISTIKQQQDSDYLNNQLE